MFGHVRQAASEIMKLYRGLSPWAQRAVLASLAVEVVLIAAVERDIQRQPTDRVRGPKLLWRVIATQNVVGPLAYLAFGRKRT